MFHQFKIYIIFPLLEYKVQIPIRRKILTFVNEYKLFLKVTFCTQKYYTYQVKIN